MTLANKLTLLRIALVPFFMIFFYTENFYSRIVALLIFIGASLTDLYDGIVARKYNQVTDFGKFADPLADKLLVCSAFISFVGLKELLIPAWMVLIIISREFIITGIRLIGISKNKTLDVSFIGKFKTTSQMTTIITILTLLVISSGLKKFLNTDINNLLAFGDWRSVAGYSIRFGPFILMFITTILTLASGINYLIRYRFLFINEKK